MPDSLVPVHACFELLLDGRHSEAQSLFPADVVEAAMALLAAERSLESAGTPAPAQGDCDSASLIGVEIAGFELLESLGEGASGQVYRARQLTPERHVALKLLWPCSRAEALEQRREAAMLAPLEHPGIARLYQVGVWEHAGAFRPWIAMELVDGARPLDSASTAALPIHARVALLADVADAVAYAHSKGVIHRDLKPGNVLLGRGGSSKVIDFGLARQDTPSRERSIALLGDRIVGSLASIAPECLAAGAMADTRSDVFSLGTIAYGVLAGRPMRAISGMSIAQAMRAIATMPTPRLAAANPRLRGDLDRVVTKATDPDPARRYASMELLARDLRDHLAGRPVLIEQQPLHERIFRSARRHWRVWAAAAVLAIALLSATTVSLRYAQRAREQAVLANLRVAAGAVESCDLQTLDRAIAAIGDADSPEVDLLERIAALRGQFMSPHDWYALALSPDGSWVVGSCATGLPGDNGGLLVRWDGATERWRIKLQTAMTGGIHISPDGRLICVAHIDEGISIVDAESGSVMHTWNLRPGPVGGMGRFLADGRLLYAHTDACIVRLDGTPDGPWFDPGVGLVRAIDELPDGLVAIAGHDGAAVVDIRTGRVVRRLDCPAANQTAMWANPSDGTLLVGGWDRTVRAYAPGSSMPSWTGRAHRDFVWSIAGLDAIRAASAGTDGAIAIWNVGSGSCTMMPGSPDMVWALLPTRDGMWIASRGGLRIQSPESMALWAGTPADRRQLTVGSGWRAWLDPQGDLHLVGDDGTPRPTAELPERASILAGGGDMLCALREDGTLVCIDVAQGRPSWSSDQFRSTPEERANDTARSALVSMSVNAQDGRLLIAARMRGCVAVDLLSGDILWERPLEQLCVRVAWSPSGAVYAAGREGLISKLTRSGHIEREVRHQRRRTGAMVGEPTGARLFVGGSDGIVRILDADTLDERLAIRVSDTGIASMWIDDSGVWTIDDNGIVRCR